MIGLSSVVPDAADTRADVVVVTTWAQFEAVSVSRTIAYFLQQSCGLMTYNLVDFTPESDGDAVEGCRCVLVLLQPGVLAQGRAAACIELAVRLGKACCPVMADGSGFEFPDKDVFTAITSGGYLSEAEWGIAAALNAEAQPSTVSTAYQRLFKVIASPVSPTGSMEEIRGQCRAIAHKVGQLHRAKTSDKLSSDKLT